MAEAAITFLNKLYQNIDSRLADQLVEVRKDYIGACVRELKNGVHATPSPSLATAERCLSLLDSFLNETERVEGLLYLLYCFLFKIFVFITLTNDDVVYYLFKVRVV